MKWLFVFAVVTLGLAITIGILGADSERVVRLPVPSATDQPPAVDLPPGRSDGGRGSDTQQPPSDPVGDFDCGPECYNEELEHADQ